jgi:hypothetical protein
MDNKKKKQIFSLLVAIATIILIAVGSTFAYFSATVSSNEGAIKTTAAVFEVDLVDDTSLIKTGLIPSEEIYVDYATKYRVDENGEFLKPYKKDGVTIREKTACIDDNLNEICSIYTFTVQNPMTQYDLPIYVTMMPSVNTFKNLYFKVLDSKQEEIVSKTHLYDDREFTLDANGDRVFAEGSKMSSIVLDGIDVTIPKAKEENGKVIPSEVTFSIIMWIDETGYDQTKEDSMQVFTGGIKVESSGADGGGITGIFTAGGEE